MGRANGSTASVMDVGDIISSLLEEKAGSGFFINVDAGPPEEELLRDLKAFAHELGEDKTIFDLSPNNIKDLVIRSSNGLHIAGRDFIKYARDRLRNIESIPGLRYTDAQVIKKIIQISGIVDFGYKYFSTKEYVLFDLEAFAHELGEGKAAFDLNTQNIKDLSITCSNGRVASGSSYLYFASKSSFGFNLAKLKRVAGFDPEFMLDKDIEDIRALGLEEVIGIFRDDPLKLQIYLQFAFPEMPLNQVNKIVVSSFKGLHSSTNTSREKKYLNDYKELLKNPAIESEIPKAMENNSLTISGKCEGATHIYFSGTWSSRVKLANDGSFVAVLPLCSGKKNNIKMMSLHAEEGKRSKQLVFYIVHTGTADDVKSITNLLDQLKAETQDQIQKEEGRLDLLVTYAEQILIKKFAYDFEQGLAYVQDLLDRTKSTIMREVLGKVISNFKKIDAIEIKNFNSDRGLKFFQKYTHYETRKRMERRDPGMINASDPGLGKTITTLASINSDPAIIVSPNPVVSTWQEEAQKFLKVVDLLKLQGIPSEERKKILADSESTHVVTNIEFLRTISDPERFELLSGDGNKIMVYDEGHSLANRSKQTKGAQLIKNRFLLMLSASPFKNPKAARKILNIFYPEDARFSSDSAFDKAFPSDDPLALKNLYLILSKLMIRFRKEDVLDELDPDVPLSEQSGKLPQKKFFEEGEYSETMMSEEQARAIYEMFLNWNTWCEKYDKYIPKDDTNKIDQLWSADRLTMKHAFRQTINNPAFIGIEDLDSVKTDIIRKIIEKCQADGRKIVIFCRYNAQANKYFRIFSHLNPALYTGEVSKQKYVKDDDGNKKLFLVDKNKRFILDEEGRPIESDTGEPMLPLDYERFKFQNQEDCQLIISTFSAGSMGITFTAGKAMIDDDLPEHYIEMYQSDDRIHRMDDDHKTHYDVWYFRIVCKYPEDFLEEMKNVWVRENKDDPDNIFYEEVKDKAQADVENLPTAYELFFEQGSYDEVQMRNLKAQKQVFKLIHDGIADEELLFEDMEEFFGIN